MEYEKVYLVPLIHFIWYMTNLTVTYIVAVHQEHVYPIFPYISDLGAFMPESALFKQTINMGSALSTSVACIRYWYVENFCEGLDNRDVIRKWNQRSFVKGIMAGILVSILANFGVMEALTVHLVAAAGAFYCLLYYLWTQVWISLKMYPAVGNRNVIETQALLVVVSLLSLSLILIFGALALWHYEGNIAEFDFTKWSPNHAGYTYHLISVFSEWVLVISIICFLSLYTWDFKNIAVMTPVYKLKRNACEHIK